MISLKPHLLSRYADVAGLLYKYGRADIVRDSGLGPSVENLQHPADDNTSGKPSPEDFAKDLESRGPAYIKLGQMLSTRSELLPEAYLEALTRLQDDVKPVPFEDLREIITAELGVRISKAFKSFQEKPLAAASVGQVHRAELHDGRQVVVKIQRPGIRPEVIQDLEVLTELAEFLDHHTTFGREAALVDLVASLHDTLLEEMDYRQEADNARILRQNLSAFPTFVVPKIIDDFSSSHVITMEFISGTKITDISPTVLLEIDREAKADELFRVYLHQVLIDGCFHADPHPGNILLTHDGKIALMDFGMVTRVAPPTQRRLLKLLLSLCDGLVEEAARAVIEMSQPRSNFNEKQFTQEISLLVSKYQHRSLNDLEAGKIVMAIQGVAGRCGLRIPYEMSMLGKTLLNLDKVVATLAPDFNPQAALRRHATEMMRNQSKNRITLSSLYHSVIEATEFAQNLPARANRLAELLANNQLRVRVDAIDEKRLLSGMHKIANRITTGLVLAALIIGASMLMQSEKAWMMTMATIFFVFAALCSSVLTFKVLFGDESPPKSND